MKKTAKNFLPIIVFSVIILIGLLLGVATNALVAFGKFTTELVSNWWIPILLFILGHISGIILALWNTSRDSINKESIEDDDEDDVEEKKKYLSH